MDASGSGVPGSQEEGVALAQELFAPAAIQDRAAVDLRVHAVREARGQVRLDDAGNDVDARPLGGEHQMDAHGAGLLGDAGDALLHLRAADHHEVRQLVDDHHHVGQGLQEGGTVRPTGVRRAVAEVDAAAGLDELGVEALQVPHGHQGQTLVAILHLGHHPLQHASGLLHVGDHRGPEVRDVLVDAQLHHLGIHQDQLHFAGERSQQQGHDHGVDAHALAAARGAADEQVGHLAEIGHHGVSRDILAERERQQALRVLLAGVPELGAVHDLAEADDLAVGVGHLDAHQVPAGDAVDADLLGLEAQGEILFHAQHLGQGHSGVGLELVDGDDGAGLHAHHLALHLELGELLSDELLGGLQQRGIQPVLRLGGIEEAPGRQLQPVHGTAGGLQGRWRDRGGLRGSVQPEGPARIRQGPRGRGFRETQGRLLHDATEAVLHHDGRHQGRLGRRRRRQVPQQGRRRDGHARGRAFALDDHGVDEGDLIGRRVQLHGVDHRQTDLRWELLVGLLVLEGLPLGSAQGFNLLLLGLLLPAQARQLPGVVGIQVRGRLTGAPRQEGMLDHAEEPANALAGQGPEPGPSLVAHPPGQQAPQRVGEGRCQDQARDQEEDGEGDGQAHGTQGAAKGGP